MELEYLISADDGYGNLLSGDIGKWYYYVDPKTAAFLRQQK